MDGASACKSYRSELKRVSHILTSLRNTLTPLGFDYGCLCIRVLRRHGATHPLRYQIVLLHSCSRSADDDWTLPSLPLHLQGSASSVATLPHCCADHLACSVLVHSFCKSCSQSHDGSVLCSAFDLALGQFANSRLELVRVGQSCPFRSFLSEYLFTWRHIYQIAGARHSFLFPASSATAPPTITSNEA